MGRKSNLQLELEKEAKRKGWIAIEEEVKTSKILSGFIKFTENTISFEGFVKVEGFFTKKTRVYLTFGHVFNIYQGEGESESRAVWNIALDKEPMVVGEPRNERTINNLLIYTKEIRAMLLKYYDDALNNKFFMPQRLTEEEIAIDKEDRYRCGK